MSLPFAPNTTQIPNCFIDFWMNLLTGSEFKLLMAIARKTFGWHKDRDAISKTQLELLTGLSPKQILDSLKVLVEHQLIEEHERHKPNGADAPNEYRIRVHTSPFGELKESLAPIETRGGGASNLGGDPLETRGTKETNTKETKKTVCTAVAADTIQMAAPPSERPATETIVKRNYRGDEVMITRSRILENALKFHSHWKTEDIAYAIKTLIETDDIVNDCWGFVEGIMRNIENARKAQATTKRKGEEKCQNKTAQATNSSERTKSADEMTPSEWEEKKKSLGIATWEQHLRNLNSRQSNLTPCTSG